MKVALDKPKRTAESGATRTIHWKESPPFSVNPRGILTHRVRMVSTHYASWGQHCHATHWCGSGFNFEPALIEQVLVEDPPESRLLCENCERRAAQKKKPSADELAGHHVHKGVLKAYRTCCRETDNN